MKRKVRHDRGFTFIEILITLMVIGIAFVPLMRMFATSLDQVIINGELTSARYLVQSEMEKVKNGSFTEAQWLAQGWQWIPPIGSAPTELNGRHWRVLRAVIPDTDPLEVRVQAFRVTDAQRSEPTEEPLAELVTLIEDLDWGAHESPL